MARKFLVLFGLVALAFAVSHVGRPAMGDFDDDDFGGGWGCGGCHANYAPGCHHANYAPACHSVCHSAYHSRGSYHQGACHPVSTCHHGSGYGRASYAPVCHSYHARVCHPVQSHAAHYGGYHANQCAPVAHHAGSHVECCRPAATCCAPSPVSYHQPAANCCY